MSEGGKVQARFGHTAVWAKEGRLFVFGGAVESSDSSFITTNDSFALECETGEWRRLPNSGVIPCQRAAHAMVRVDRKEALLFGGALVGGHITKEQLYHVQIKKRGARWSEVRTTGEAPAPRYGHSLVFAKPLLVLFGGSTGTEMLCDTWALNLSQKKFAWERIECAGLAPSPRVYHFAELCSFGGANGMIIVHGGRDAENRMLNEVWGLRRHRNGRWDWVTPPTTRGRAEATGRCQHTTTFFGTLMFNVGGKLNERFCNAVISVYDYEYNKWYAAPGPECFRHISWIWGGRLFVQGGLNNANKIFRGGEPLAYDLLEHFREYSDLCAKLGQYLERSELMSLSGLSSGGSTTTSPVPRRPPTREATVPSKREREEIRVRLPGRATESVRRVPDVADRFIEKLLRPKTYLNLAPDAELDFTAEQICELATQAQAVVERQPMVVAAESPAKIFGDIHGQYSDLMRFFDLWGAPCNPEEEGGLGDNYTYVFLGDYVDRGNHSLETICLLMALKVRFPDSVFLLRGNHEDRWINQSFGFYDECQARLRDSMEAADGVFSRINQFFEYLPLAAVIDGTLFCIHGGIGSSLRRVEDVLQIPRPLEVVHEVTTPLEKLVVDLLWSDPTDNDAQLGVHPNSVRDPHGSGNIVKFGPDVVRRFLAENGLSKIIRAHECVMDGFERFAGGDLITVFSATDYCGKHKNAGAILVISKRFSINPKLIYPSIQQANWIEDGENGYRPPTPPRWHPAPQSY